MALPVPRSQRPDWVPVWLWEFLRSDPASQVTGLAQPFGVVRALGGGALPRVVEYTGTDLWPALAALLRWDASRLQPYFGRAQARGALGRLALTDVGPEQMPSVVRALRQEGERAWAGLPRYPFAAAFYDPASAGIVLSRWLPRPLIVPEARWQDIAAHELIHAFEEGARRAGQPASEELMAALFRLAPDVAETPVETAIELGRRVLTGRATGLPAEGLPFLRALIQRW